MEECVDEYITEFYKERPIEEPIESFNEIELIASQEYTNSTTTSKNKQFLLKALNQQNEVEELWNLLDYSLSDSTPQSLKVTPENTIQQTSNQTQPIPTIPRLTVTNESPEQLIAFDELNLTIPPPSLTANSAFDIFQASSPAPITPLSFDDFNKF